MNKSPGSKEPIQVALTSIDDSPYQMRTTYDESQLAALVTSIKELGLLQVPLARKVGERFELAFGHRRKRAFDQLYQSDWAGIVSQVMPLIVLPLTDREMFEVSLSENLKRADLSPVEKATALKRYMDEFGATSAQAAKIFGIPEGTIRGTVRLLKLSEEDQQKLSAGQISQSHARRILKKPAASSEKLEPEPNRGPFDLREQLMILLYDRPRSDVTDELLIKKVRAILEWSKQLEHQLELMNGQKLAGAKERPNGHSIHARAVSVQ